MTKVAVVRGGEVYVGATFVKHDLYIKDGKIDFAPGPDGEFLDATGCYVIPGLVDLHFHGAAGADISDGDLEGIHKMAAYQASRGVTSICPATMTLSEEILTKAAQSAAAFEPAENEADLVGLNMEGPFISPDKVGAQNPEYVHTPDVEMFRRLQEQAGGLFKLVDIAPEEEGAMEFIDQLKDEVRISIAHTCTDYETAAEAFKRGASHMTHLYNAMPSLHHRKPGPIAAGAENTDVMAEIIADGVHIHPAMVRLAFNMFGPDRMILISDTLRAVGLPDGVYDLGGQDVTVKGAVATIENGALAGSVSDLMRCLNVAVKEMGIPLIYAVKAASVNPARALGYEGVYGTLAMGGVANMVLLDKETLEIRGVVLRGELIPSTPC